MIKKNYKSSSSLENKKKRKYVNHCSWGVCKWEQILLCLHCRKGLAALEEHNPYLNKEYFLLFLGHAFSKKVFFLFFFYLKEVKHCCDDTARDKYAPLQIDTAAGMPCGEFGVTCRPCGQHIRAIVCLSGLAFCFLRWTRDAVRSG